jgi:hypothetical protein
MGKRLPRPVARPDWPEGFKRAAPSPKVERSAREDAESDLAVRVCSSR